MPAPNPNRAADAAIGTAAERGRADALNALERALLDQHSALLAGDAPRMADAAGEFARALAALTRPGAVAAVDRQTLAALRDRAAVNSGLLARRRAANERALREIFGSEATYGRQGAADAPASARSIGSA